MSRSVSPLPGFESQIITILGGISRFGFRVFVPLSYRVSRTATTISVLKNSVVVYSESNGDTFVPFVGIANNGDSIEVTQPHLEYTTSNGEAPPGTVCVSECYNVNEAVPGKKNQRYSGQAPTYT